jgi:hypothetical protein
LFLNGNLEVPAYFLKAKQEYTYRKLKKVHAFILISAGMKFSNEKKFRYGILAYTFPFRALDVCTHMQVRIHIIVVHSTKRQACPSNFFKWIDNIKIDLQETGCGDMNYSLAVYLKTLFQ